MAIKPHRIDFHHHIVPSEYISALNGIGVTDVAGITFPDWDIENTLAVMDRHGIATAITSISAPGVYFGDGAFAIDLARRCNELSARLISEYPQRFGAFAVLPLPDVKAALLETEYALDTLKLDGVTLLTNVEAHYLGDPIFDDLLYELNRRKAVVFTHPAVPPGSEMAKLQMPGSFIDFVFDTTRAVGNLLYTGSLERYPDIRFILPHAGGAVPYLAWRIGLIRTIPGLKEKMPQRVNTYLQRLYYETALSTSPYALRSLQELIEPSHILFGSDFPFAAESLTAQIVAGLEQYDGFDEPTRMAIERDNALELIPRLKSA